MLRTGGAIPLLDTPVSSPGTALRRFQIQYEQAHIRMKAAIIGSANARLVLLVRVSPVVLPAMRDCGVSGAMSVSVLADLATTAIRIHEGITDVGIDGISRGEIVKRGELGSR